MVFYQKCVDYCPDDSVQVIPKYHKDYVPEGVDPVTLQTLEVKEEVKIEPKVEEKVVPTKEITGFKCNICDYECKTERGMQTHVGRAHKE